MAVLAWGMMGLAIWHFTIFLPDHFWGGIVGAFLGALIGAIVFGFVINGFTVQGQGETHLLTALEGIPGAVLGLALVYVEGLRRAVIDARCSAEGGAPEPRQGRKRRAHQTLMAHRRLTAAAAG